MGSGKRERQGVKERHAREKKDCSSLSALAPFPLHFPGSLHKIRAPAPLRGPAGQPALALACKDGGDAWMVASCLRWTLWWMQSG